jgi:hypothetical protein
MNRLAAFLQVSWLLTAGACVEREPARTWLIPQGYVGWLRLDFSVDGARPFPIENGHYVARMPRSGRSRTSTNTDRTVEGDSYYAEDGGGRRHQLRLVWEIRTMLYREDLPGKGVRLTMILWLIHRVSRILDVYLWEQTLT